MSLRDAWAVVASLADTRGAAALPSGDAVMAWALAAPPGDAVSDGPGGGGSTAMGCRGARKGWSCLWMAQAATRCMTEPMATEEQR